jgi:hypothetical protein
MLTTAFPFLLPHHLERDLPAKLRTLADDLDNLRCGTGPTTSDIATAPLLVDWHGAITATGLRLAGFAAGYPRLGNRPVLTSQIWAADADGRWVRTLSRYYRLGIPAGAHLLASQDESADNDDAAGDRHD